MVKRSGWSAKSMLQFNGIWERRGKVETGICAPAHGAFMLSVVGCWLSTLSDFVQCDLNAFRALPLL
jgi:hypothetical protein